MNNGKNTNPEGKGGQKSGEPGRNPLGLSKHQAEAREWIRDWLAKPEQRDAGAQAYRELLVEKNPLIVKDFMDRVGGRVKDSEDTSGVQAFVAILRELLSAPTETKEALADQLEAAARDEE